MTKKQGSTHLGRTAMAALELHKNEQQQQGNNKAFAQDPRTQREVLPSTPQTTAHDQIKILRPLEWRDIPLPSAKARRRVTSPYSHKLNRRRPFWRSLPSWRSMMARLMPAKYTPSKVGKRVVAAYERAQKQVRDGVISSAPVVTLVRNAALPKICPQISALKNVIAEFRTQARLFSVRYGHIVAPSLFAVGFTMLTLSGLSFAPQGTAQSIQNNSTIAASGPTISIKPLVVVNGHMDDGAVAATTITANAQQADAAPVIILSGTPKTAPHAKTASRITKVKPNGVKTPHLAKKPTTSAKRVAHAIPDQKNIDTLKANALQLFHDARNMAGRNDIPKNNVAALKLYLRGSSLAQRVDLFSNGQNFMRSETVRNAHAELALLYTGVPDIEPNMSLVANTMKLANPNSATGQKVMQRLQVQNPLLYAELSKTIVKDAVDSASTLKRPGRVHVTLDPRTKTLRF